MLPPPTLLVLAAGMGSRYGGLKQLDPLGPSGETVLDYGVYDAARAGFGRVVFIIRRDFDAQFRNQVGAKYAGHLAVDYAYQALDALPKGYRMPEGREKPWGTGHAVWCAREQLDGPFAVINADDFYGADSFAQLAQFLQNASPENASKARAAMVGFQLKNTLSENGAVSRGICLADAQSGQLQSITEHTGILATEVGTAPSARYSGDEITSMNCWGFGAPSSAFLDGLDTELRHFLDSQGRDLKSEFYLPAAVSALIARNETTVQLLPTTSQWFGVTYREDRAQVVARIAALVAAGEYPKKLF
ncbi:nucleotidyltransferase [Cephaloticoccus capnophilus]|uniref:Nucleotidyltransferase n=1 Tax=Cephaloticoccus capnophilus TaxID=1548208 RepID=A0A139SK71_9BACT|nr:sugar phosphate nucleotidyltransferase [Cephaloticoccus capnophilus]KXU34953.1 nucleotidyltransferase [Cephaloticoccus capnophilus]